jgi:hypothetical protein
MPHRSRRAYDHRIKEQIIRAGNPDLLPELEIPRSTAVSWIRRGLGEVVSLDPDGCEPCPGYFPPPPQDRSGVAAEQGLMIALGSARIAPCSGSPATGL